MFGKKRERAKLPGFCELSVAFLPQIVKGRSRPTKERLRPYLLGELIYFFLYGGVVIPSGLKPLFTLRAVAPLALHTRIVKIGLRKGDAAMEVVLELV